MLVAAVGSSECLEGSSWTLEDRAGLTGLEAVLTLLQFDLAIRGTTSKCSKRKRKIPK